MANIIIHRVLNLYDNEDELSSGSYKIKYQNIITEVLYAITFGSRLSCVSNPKITGTIWHIPDEKKDYDLQICGALFLQNTPV